MGKHRVILPYDGKDALRFKPTADGVFVTTHGLGNDWGPLASIRKQDRQAALGQVGAADAIRLFKDQVLLRGQFNSDHQVSPNDSKGSRAD